MKINLNRAHYPVTTLGPGRRIGLWFQGCHVGCRGCIARDTWNAQEDNSVEIGDLLDWFRTIEFEGCAGITISGGEPFEQPAGLSSLLDGILCWRQNLTNSVDILCYSGFPFKRLKHNHGFILSKIDALIPEPFMEHLPSNRSWRGSRNQRLIPLSALGRERYCQQASETSVKASLQVSVEGSRVTFIGIPKRDDMTRLEEASLRRGIRLKDVSWRA